jgi:hypothetical protein
MVADEVGFMIAALRFTFTLSACLYFTPEEIEARYDVDGDGVDWTGDCDDSDAAIYPGAEEIPYDGVDNDCDGADLTDVDGDGHDGPGAGGADCDDDNAAVNPGQAETPYNGVDDDCDGATPDDDLDDDGVGVLDAEVPDCDDEAPTIYPGATESCGDGINSDCVIGWECGVESGVHALSSAALILESEQGETGPWVGDRIDREGDDWRFAVGSPYWLLQGVRVGGVHVTMGPLESGDLLGTNGVTLSMEDGNGHSLFGGSVTRVYDMNRDGTADLGVGAPGDGLAFVIFGPFTESEELRLINSMEPGDEAAVLYSSEGTGDLGHSLSRGQPEVGQPTYQLLIGAPEAGDDTQGRAYMLDSPLPAGRLDLAGDSPNHLLQVLGEEYGDRAGWRVLATESAPRGATVDLADADLKLTGEQPGDQAGFYMDYLGPVMSDVDDGITLAVGVPGGSDSPGRVYLFSADTLDELVRTDDTFSLDEADTIFVGEAPGDEAAVVTQTFWVNDDIYYDFMVGAPGRDEERGGAYLVFGGPWLWSDGATVELAELVEGYGGVFFEGEVAGSRAGASLIGALNALRTPGLDSEEDLYNDLFISQSNVSPSSFLVFPGGPGL